IIINGDVQPGSGLELRLAQKGHDGDVSENGVAPEFPYDPSPLGQQIPAIDEYEVRGVHVDHGDNILVPCHDLKRVEHGVYELTEMVVSTFLYDKNGPHIITPQAPVDTFPLPQDHPLSVS